MKKGLICTSALLLALSLPVFASSAEELVAASAPGAVTLLEAVKANGTIAAIDTATRKVTLKNAAGQTMSVMAGEGVKNFDKLKVGDKVKAEYMQVLTLELLGAGSNVREHVTETSSASAPAAKAGGFVGEKLTVVGNVIGVDAKKHTIRVQGVNRTVTLKVRDPAQFKMIKKGDQIKGTYTQALAMLVTAAK
ncbi:hypothetical protein [uncultured Deefgea sp.]|uniref:hypothetical protein n=1 Tax=uncultured Deefgea sp. TaxID=1304914 RepID=UPI00262D348A|nr:hypothetical protein [uncultured Deefgea sp.]